MPFDLNADSWLNARAMVAEYGENAVDEIWWRAQHMSADGPRSELAKLLAVLQAIKVLRRPHEMGLTVH